MNHPGVPYLMATPAPVVSNTATVTEAGGTPAITIAASPANLPPSGGTVAIAGTTNEPDGTPLELYLNGVDTGISTASVGGTFLFTYTVLPNASLLDVALVFVVTTGGPPPTSAPASPPA